MFMVIDALFIIVIVTTATIIFIVTITVSHDRHCLSLALVKIISKAGLQLKMFASRRPLHDLYISKLDIDRFLNRGKNHCFYQRTGRNFMDCLIELVVGRRYRKLIFRVDRDLNYYSLQW